MEERFTFEELEDRHQSLYDDIRLAYEGRVVVNVTLLRFRNVSVSSLSDLVDTPDPQFRVTCPKVENEELRTFVTRSIGDDVTSGTINQTFKFVDTKASLNPSEAEDFPIIIELYDLDIIWNDFIGKQEINASTLEIGGKPLQQTLTFGENRGNLDVVVSREKKTAPDFRFSLGLCTEERDFRKKRMPIVHEAIKAFIGHKNGPRNLQETPVVSLVCSGGGYRAVTGMCGAMEALKDAGVLDAIMYTCGLSGSAWYLSSAYALQGISKDNQTSFNETMKERLASNFLWDVLNPLNLIEYEKYRRRTYKAFDQPHNIVNYFPSFIVGKNLLGEKNHVNLSELSHYIEDAKVPYPIFTAIHLKNRIEAGDFHAYMERSPHEIYLPCYGIGIHPNQEGSVWNEGILVREGPEYPLNFTIGMTGCAFCILLNAFIESGGEKAQEFLNFIEQERTNGTEYTHLGLDKSHCSSDLELNDEEDELEDEEHETYTPLTSTDKRHDEAENLVEPNLPASNLKHEEAGHCKMWFHNILSSRNTILERTAQINNLVLGFDRVKRFCLNPFGITKNYEGQAKELIEALGVCPTQKKISTKRTSLGFGDAGVLKNVPTESVLRPQRTTDIMIVMDFSAYESDDSFSYSCLLSAAAHAWQSGLKFPNINFEKITNLPPQEFFIFPSDGEGCPTVLWFTLSNKKFKSLKHYTPKSKEKPPSGEERDFNDFVVFGDDSFCSTFTFQYSNYNFDQLRELMYYNVTSHIEDIKTAFVSATKNKRTRLASNA